ncbi:ABC transporter permease [Niallia sp. 01092]|uniref:ABC transporter permease n=2 Tax=unclassified Niallia TaxID=2837522 RepID=UPI003FCFC827
MYFMSLLWKELKFFTNLHNRMYQFILFFQPLLFLSITFFLLEVRETAASDHFVVASSLISMWSYVLYSSGSALIGQKWSDTLQLLLASPTSLFRILFTKTISNSFIAFISMIISFIYAALIFHFNIGIQNYTLFFIAVIVLLFSLSVVGILLALVFVAFKNVFDYQNLIVLPMLLICGVYVPVDSMPTILQWIAYAMPMTWGIHAVYDSINVSKTLFHSIYISLIISFTYLVISFFVIKKIEKVLRKNGRIGEI